MSERFASFAPLEERAKTPPGGLHISVFVIVRKDGSILLGRRLKPEGWKNKLALPASLLKYGEHPEEGVKRTLKEQISAEPSEVSLIQVQSHISNHWDVCFLYEAKLSTEGTLSDVISELNYYPADNLRREELVGGHKDVIDAWMSNQIKIQYEV